jgi:hypothetical protein
MKRKIVAALFYLRLPLRFQRSMFLMYSEHPFNPGWGLGKGGVRAIKVNGQDRRKTAGGPPSNGFGEVESMIRRGRAKIRI